MTVTAKIRPDTVVVEGVRFHHFHDIQTGRLCLTIATRMREDGQIDVAGAVCSRKDNPNRALGKHIAQARLVGDKAKFVTLDLTEFKRLVTSREIAGVFPSPDRFVLRPRREVTEATFTRISA